MSVPPSENIPKVLTLDGIDGMGVTPEEAFVLSRVNGQSSLSEIAKILGYDTAKVWRTLERFVEKGVVEIQAGRAGARKFVRGGQKSILESLDAEETDPILNKLPRSVRNDICVAYEELSRKSHYEVLGLMSKATADEIKRSYFDRVKTYHPDRFFGQEVGHYREKLEAVFGRISKAFDELGDPIKRKAYDRSLEKKETKSEPGVAEVEEPIKLTTRTLIEQLALARRYFDLAKQEETKGKEVAAANFYQMAWQYDPKNPTYVRAAERSKPILDRKRAEGIYSRGVDAFDRGDRASAIALLEETLLLNPRKKECYRDLARIYVNHKSSLPRAKELGLRAAEFYPNEAEVHATMGLIYKELGEANLAKKEFKVALSLDRDNKMAKRGLTDLERK